MIKICPSCNKSNEISIDFECVNFVCKHCHVISDQNNKTFERFGAKPRDYSLELNNSAIIDGKEYWVTGIIIKVTGKIYSWREYCLRSKDHDTLYLSEYDGHWIKLKEANVGIHNIGNRKHTKSVYYGDKMYYLFNWNTSNIKYAEGFFDFEITKSNHLVIDFIAPPDVVSVEKYSDIQNEFVGEHISDQTIKNLFNLKYIPAKNGIGMAEPSVYENINKNIYILLFFVGIIFCLHFVFKSYIKPKTVLAENINLLKYNDKKAFVSSSFELEGNMNAPLYFRIASEVDNNWVEMGVSLINDKTQEETYTSEGLERYSGYEDGEHWTEGETYKEFNICSVKPGKYHFELTPYSDLPPIIDTSFHIDPSALSINYSSISYPTNIYIRAAWGEDSIWNTGISILILLLSALGLFLYKDHFEKRRWSVSDYGYLK